jgi:hypothetical protein
MLRTKTEHSKRKSMLDAHGTGSPVPGANAGRLVGNS